MEAAPPRRLTQRQQESIAEHGEHHLEASKFRKRVLVKVGRHCKVTTGGRVFSVSALVVSGDGVSTAGLGYGKGSTFRAAFAKAARDAQKKAITVHKWDGRTISHAMSEKYCRARVKLWPLPPHSGVRASSFMTDVLECWGLEDIRVKTYGRRNDHNILRALIRGLLTSESETQVAERLGRNVFDVSKIWRVQDRTRAF